MSDFPCERELASGIAFFNQNVFNGQDDGICPLRELLTRLGDKWSVLLILTLSKMPERRGHFSEIKRSIPGISQRMLTATLRNLERYGILQREIFAKLDPMKEIGVWIVGNWSTIRSSRTEFDNRLRLGK